MVGVAVDVVVGERSSHVGEVAIQRMFGDPMRLKDSPTSLSALSVHAVSDDGMEVEVEVEVEGGAVQTSQSADVTKQTNQSDGQLRWDV